MRMDHVPNRRALIDHRAVARAVADLPDAAPEALRLAATDVLRTALEAGRAEIARRLLATPSRGLDTAAAGAYLTDRLLVILWDVVTRRLYPGGDAPALVAVGGYGRGEMAPHSDVDIAVLTPGPRSPRQGQVVEALLYALWDLGLAVGHSVRSVDETIALAMRDATVRTALLEGRYVAGDAALHAECQARLRAEMGGARTRAFIADKLTERDARHHRMGDSRYVVEPNVKEGKGGLRDLHTLFWIGKYAYGVARATDLVGAGLLTREEYRRFNRAENFLWAVRCHLHVIAGRAEERLTFDDQREIAERMRFTDRPGKSRTERFMQMYFLQAKAVGDLTGVFLAHLDEAFAARGRRLGASATVRRPRRLAGFVLDRGRLALPDDAFFQDDPVRLVELFTLAEANGLEIHPLAMRAVARDAKLADGIRRDPRANALFLDLLCGRRDPETVLRWMNEGGVFGRFVPDFGRVVAQMQFDMYHHYTVDEHTIRAIGLLSRIERGALADDHPLATGLMDKIVSRRALYVAVLLHDIAKGRGGDHSVLGAEVARRLCPRFGLTPAETDSVAWLVRWHLLMSDTALKRDLSDFKTILDFAQAVQSPQRLMMLLVLTVVDIRAVGPGVWNGWKRQLLGSLYEAAEEVLRLGHKQRGRSERIAAKQADLAAALTLTDAELDALRRRLPEAYWVAEPPEVLEANVRLVRAAGDASLWIAAVPDEAQGATLVTIYAADHPGLFYRIAGAIHAAGGNIIDARIHTTRDGMALDNLLVQDPLGRPFDDAGQLERLREGIADALANRTRLRDRLRARGGGRSRANAFRVPTAVLVDNAASNRFTVVEVSALDRPALLHHLADALFQSRVTIHSAHVATYGERAVDTFYVTDLTGDKLGGSRVKAIEKRLADAATAPA